MQDTLLFLHFTVTIKSFPHRSVALSYTQPADRRSLPYACSNDRCTLLVFCLWNPKSSRDGLFNPATALTWFPWSVESKTWRPLLIAGSGKIILIESKNMYRGRAVVRKNWQKRKEKNILKNIQMKQLGIHLQQIQTQNEQKGFKVSNKFFYTFSYKLSDCSPTDMKLCF